MKSLRMVQLGGVIGGGLVAAALLASTPAQADLGHNTWTNEIGHAAIVPHVDTSVHQSR